MKFFAKYKFTNKRHSMKAVMAVILALIGIVSMLICIVLSFKNGGEASLNFGAVFLLSMVMSAVGLVLAIISRTEPDRYYLFSNLGILLNILVLAAGGGILALGLS